MKQITMFITSWCPYCKQAEKMMEELSQNNPEYQKLNIEIIDEELHPNIAREYDYYYVPTFFVDKEKLHEGVPTKDAIKKVFDAALN